MQVFPQKLSSSWENAINRKDESLKVQKRAIYTAEFYNLKRKIEQKWYCPKLEIPLIIIIILFWIGERIVTYMFRLKYREKGKELRANIKAL